MAKKPAPKKAAKPVKKAAKPVKAAAKKPAAKKAVSKAKPATKKQTKPAAKPVAKKAAKPGPAKKVAPVSKKAAPKPSPKPPAKPVAKQAPKPAKAAPKAAPKPAAKVAAPAPKAPARPVAPAKPAPPAPAQKAAPAKASSDKPAAKASVKKEDSTKSTAKPLVTQTSVPVIHKAAPMVKKQVSTLESPNKERYSDSELEEFKKIILNKLEEARRDYDLLKQTLANTDNNGTEDTSPSFKMIEDGSETLSREETAQLAGRQEKFIKHLEDALLRIRNKTYGICRVTGRLISKERLRLVPHATLSIEAKQQMSS
jgi:RNA polymerase-binding transcription factor DksA